jgi:hypothetical protein
VRRTTTLVLTTWGTTSSPANTTIPSKGFRESVLRCVAFQGKCARVCAQVCRVRKCVRVCEVLCS